MRESPSSRRAWIEIWRGLCIPRFITVALLAEGVDRNKMIYTAKNARKLSPSSRRAWIEMPIKLNPWSKLAVALLAEGVDRNR